MMKLAIVIVLAACSGIVVSAGKTTTVSVVEVGGGGTVRSTSAPPKPSSVVAVKSFWAALHGHDEHWKRISTHQHSGMSLAPDLLRRPDAGVVVGITGAPADFEEKMPKLSSLLGESVGPGLTLDGSVGVQLFGEDAYGASMETVQVVPSKLESVAVRLSADDEQMKVVDNQIEALVQRLSRRDGTVVVHFVIERNGSSAIGATNRRRLDQNADQGGAQEGNEAGGDNGAEGDNAADGGDNAAGGGDNAAGGAADAGDDVDCTGLSKQQCRDKQNKEKYKRKARDKTTISIYRSMFEIEFYNVVLWTSVGLTVLVVFSLGHLTHMQLMPDTLLFGESGKMTSVSE